MSSSDRDSSRGIYKGGSFPFHKNEWRRSGDFNCQGNRKSGKEQETLIIRVIESGGEELETLIIRVIERGGEEQETLIVRVIERVGKKWRLELL